MEAPITQEERYAHAQRLLQEFADSPTLDKPLATWVYPRDRHLAQALLPKSLREILSSSLDDLQKVKGVGPGRIDKLLALVERAARQMAAERNPTLAEKPAESLAPEEPAEPEEPVNPDHVSDFEWRNWCDVITAHRMIDDPLGRYGHRLSELPQGLWTTPLSEYTTLPLTEVRKLSGHGPARLACVFTTIRRLFRTLGGKPAPDGLLVRPLAAHIVIAARWVESVLSTKTTPTVEQLRERLMTPLLAQVELDLGEEACMMLRRRLGLDGPPETLLQIAATAGLTRERVRQITAKAVVVFQVRWPEGKFLLDDFYELLQAAHHAQDAVEFLRSILDACFDVQYSQIHSRAEVLAAWERAAKAKRTPMREDELRVWIASEFPQLSPEVAMNWLVASEHRAETPNGVLFFGTDPLDQVLRHLYTSGEPIPLSDVADFLEGDERNVRNRLDRDERFIEDEYRRFLPAALCGFYREGGTWNVTLTEAPGAPNSLRRNSLPVPQLAQLVVGGLIQAGICDATVWGVYRLAADLLRVVHGAILPSSVTPFVLASTLIAHSDGLVNHMRRRRLRWDSASGSVPVRGKRGWIEYVVTQAGVPLTFDELDRALRARYQDYESYALKNLDSDDDEEGDKTYSYRFVPGVSVHVPGIIIPGGWELDPECRNVSEEVRRLATRIVSASTRAPYPKTYLRRHPWLVRLCEHASFGKIRWEERALPDDESEFVTAVEEPQSEAPPKESPTPARPDNQIDDLLSGFF